jgi:hypothetical protein
MIEPERLHTVVHDGPDGPVLALHGVLSKQNAPGVDSLLTCLHDSGERLLTIDLRHAEIAPDIVELVTRRWGVEVEV